MSTKKQYRVGSDIARLDNLNTGIYAYVSLDHNVARIRRVSNGATSIIFASLYDDFPEGTYVLVFSCLGQDMSLSIEHVESSQTWILNAVSADDVKAGEWGIAAGETSAWWDWVQFDYEEVGIGETSSGLPGAPLMEPEMNPFSGRVILSAVNLVPGSRIEVFDLAGRRIRTLDPASGTVLFEPDVPGVYLAVVTGTPGLAPLKLVCLP